MLFDHEESAVRCFGNRKQRRNPPILGFRREMRRLALAMLISCAPSATTAYPTEPEPAIEAASAKSPARYVSPVRSGDTPTVHPLAPGLGSTGSTANRQEHSEQLIPLRVIRADVSAKWLDVQSRILLEQETVAACRSGIGSCSAAAGRFLSIVGLGRQHEGRARIGQINRVINLSIKPVSDLTQYGVADFWSTPLATLNAGAGDCEDYAIIKYLALRETGIAPDDLKLIVVRDIKHHTLHALVAVHIDEEWLFLDNRTLIIMNTITARYDPLFVLDHRGVRDVSSDHEGSITNDASSPTDRTD